MKPDRKHMMAGRAMLAADGKMFGGDEGDCSSKWADVAKHLALACTLSIREYMRALCSGPTVECDFIDLWSTLDLLWRVA